jgi:hypothetical protein
MSNPIPDRTFVDLVKVAVRRTFVALRRAHPDEALVGYALCTDDGLETLLCMAATDCALAASADPDLLFTPTDWPYEPEPAAADEVNQHLRDEAASTSDLRAHVDRMFGSRVLALAELRSEGLIATDVFLSVLSTDPSDYLECLETNSISSLNTASLVGSRAQFIQKWA